MWFLTGLFIFVGLVTFRPPQQMFQNVAVEEGTFSRVRDVTIIMIALLFFSWVITVKPSRWFRKKRQRKTPCIHCFQCGRKYEYKKKVEVLSQQLNVKDDQFHQLTMENQVLSEGLQNVSTKLSEVQLHLQKQLQRQGEEQEKAVESFQQVQALSPRLCLKDDQLGEITVRNNALSQDFKNIRSKFSDVQLQLEMQRKQHDEERQKNVESCQQVELLSQQLLTKENQYNEMTFVLNALLKHNTHLDNKFSQFEQHLQEQQQKQEQQNDEHRHQVVLLETDLKSKDKCLETMMFKHSESIKAMYELYRRIQQLEQSQQRPQHEPRPQLPCEQGKQQQRQTHLNNPQQDQRQENKGPRVINHVITGAVELKTTTNAWRPNKKEDVSSPDQDIIRKFRSLLNKITPEHFDRLINQIKVIHIANEDHLKDIVQLVLDKAVMESKFSGVYATMCHHLAEIEVKETSRPDNILNFRTLLIQSCENEVKKGFDVNSSLDGDTPKEKARRRALGNIVFIGELFNAEVFHESLISTTVKGLLDDGSELSLECFCRLVGVVGKILDSTQASMMDGHFTVLANLLKERKMSSRVRFMLQDLMDLRMRNWIPRQKVERPTNLQNIREEADAEQH